MSNPFLRKVNYSPGEVPPTGTVAAQPIAASIGAAIASQSVAAAAGAPAATPVGMPIAPPVLPVHPLRQLGRKMAVAAVFVFGIMMSDTLQAGVKSLWAVAKRTIGHVPVIMTAHAHELVPVEIERYSSLQAARDANPVVMSEIIDNMNRRGFRRYEITLEGSVPMPHGVYAIQPRRGFETQFSELGLRVLDRLSLYEMHVPPAWSDAQLEEKKIVWAHQCGVTPELINLWSEFVPRRGLKRVNECRPGGRCLIVSEGCELRFPNEQSMEV